MCACRGRDRAEARRLPRQLGDGLPGLPNGPIAEKRFSGGSQTFDFPDFTVKGANITPDKETGIGQWSDAELKRALVESVGRDGHAFKTPMRRARFLSRLTPEDLDSLTAYLRSLPPLE